MFIFYPKDNKLMIKEIKMKKLIPLTFAIAMLLPMQKAMSAEYCLFLDAQGSEHWVMANDCNILISDNGCQSGQSVASCPQGEPLVRCTTPTEQYLEEQRFDDEIYRTEIKSDSRR